MIENIIFRNYVKFIVCIVILSLCSNISFAQRPVSIEEAMEIARENSPDIRQAKLSLERSQELLKAQNASLKSQFSFTVEPFTYERQRDFNTLYSVWNTTETKRSSGLFSIIQPLVWTDGTISLQNRLSWTDSRSDFQDTRTKAYSNNLYLTLQQPIFTYNRQRLELEEVRLDMENSLLNYRIQELLLELHVAQSFFSAFQKKMSLNVDEEEYYNTQESFQIIKNKVDAGLAAKEELYQAELNLTSSKSKVQNDKVALENDLDEFKRLIGMDIMEDITIVAETAQEAVEIDMEKAIDHGLKNRLEIRQRDINIQTAKANLIRSAATNEFKGNIELTYGIIGENEYLENVYDVPTKNQNFNISFEIPVWDWGEQEARTNAAQASVTSNNLSLEDEKKNIIIGIRQAYRNLQNQVIQIDIARQNVKIAQLTYDINLERYKNGDLTSMDLNLFQNQLSQEKIGLVDAMINYKLALLDMKVKSLWDFEKDQNVLKDFNED